MRYERKGRKIIDYSRCMYSSKVAAKSRTSFGTGEKKKVFPLLAEYKSNAHVLKHPENRELPFFHLPRILVEALERGDSVSQLN